VVGVAVHGDVLVLVVVDRVARGELERRERVGCAGELLADLVDVVAAIMWVSRAYDAMLNGTPRNMSALRWYSWHESLPSTT
jgi:hypothetical protein